LKRRLPTPKVRDEAGRLVKEINELLARLESASAAQNRFISEAAHELRTPLTVLRSGLEVTLQAARSAEESRVAMEDALGEVEKLCRTAEDLLTLARLDAVAVLNRDLVDVRQVVASSYDTARVLAEAKHQTLVMEARTSLIVQGNGNDLRRMTLNLLDNAIKFTPESGRIAVAATREQCYALLSVSDN
jgi:signal transduction histidine kinase